ncbi:MAG TPA: ATP-binding protein [Gemmatimonadales bacterium]|nr:ATP-binding protein [Gemmatimonadales bacterium]
MRSSYSLQRTLAIRFSCTMFVGLLGFALWAFIGVRQSISPDFSVPQQSYPPTTLVENSASLEAARDQLLHEVNRSLAVRLLATVLLGTLATAVGAWWLARSAVTPVHEITAQARAIQGDAVGQRITAHADVTEFQGLVEVLNKMVGRLERSSQWHRRIIRDLGHDLRTPITAMRAGVEAALWQERSPEDYRRVLADTLEEIDRLGLISDALVLLGRLESGEVALARVEQDARIMARKAVSQAQEGVGTHSIHLVQAEEPVLISADARLMAMVLQQLLDNAKRYTPPGSHIEVTVGADGTDALLSVRDDGPGVADEVLPHLFERFYRSDQTRARGGGPGLGLTATAAIVALHGGRVTAERPPSGGLRITVSLPRAVYPAAVPGAAAHTAAALVA